MYSYILYYKTYQHWTIMREKRSDTDEHSFKVMEIGQPPHFIDGKQKPERSSGLAKIYI